MAVEFHVGTGTPPSNRWFLGEDKVIDLTIFGQDGLTPLNVSGLRLEWSLKKTDKAPDPGIIEKGITAEGASTGITIVGLYNVNPQLNTQKVRITFASEETDPDVTETLEIPYSLKPGIAYRHSLKRKDPGSEGVLTFGNCTFLQATER